VCIFDIGVESLSTFRYHYTTLATGVVDKDTVLCYVTLGDMGTLMNFRG